MAPYFQSLDDLYLWLFIDFKQPGGYFVSTPPFKGQDAIQTLSDISQRGRSTATPNPLTLNPAH